MQQENTTDVQEAGPQAPEAATPQARTFGPIGGRPQAPEQSLEDRIVARLAAMMGQQPPQAPPPGVPQAPLSPEDERLVTALAGVHPSGRSVTVISREELATHLFFLEYSYLPATGTTQTVQALVYDDGTKSHVFGGRA